MEPEEREVAAEGLREMLGPDFDRDAATTFRLWSASEALGSPGAWRWLLLEAVVGLRADIQRNTVETIKLQQALGAHRPGLLRRIFRGGE